MIISAIESPMIRELRESAREFNEFLITGGLNEVSPMDLLGEAASVFYGKRFSKQGE